MNNAKKAFSLIEFSIVVLIASIMVVGGVAITTADADKKSVIETKDKMAEIYKALGIYASLNGALPCPAALNLAKSDVDYGKMNGDPVNNGTGNCSSPVAGGTVLGAIPTNIFYGMVPTQALGLPSDFAQDAFGTKIIYVVHQDLTATGVNGFSKIAPVSTITIRETKAGGNSTATTNAAFVLISFGQNKSGGYNANSTTPNTTSADLDEIENIYAAFGTGFNNTFVNYSETSSVFDDIIFFKTRDEILVDFNLLRLIKCPVTTFKPLNTPPFNLTTDFALPEVEYGEVAISSTPCITANAAYTKGPKYPTRRCDAFGVWGATINNCMN